MLPTNNVKILIHLDTFLFLTCSLWCYKEHQWFNYCNCLACSIKSYEDFRTKLTWEADKIKKHANILICWRKRFNMIYVHTYNDVIQMKMFLIYLKFINHKIYWNHRSWQWEYRFVLHISGLSTLIVNNKKKEMPNKILNHAYLSITCTSFLNKKILVNLCLLHQESFNLPT